jgi:hypothetical protein
VENLEGAAAMGMGAGMGEKEKRRKLFRRTPHEFK